MDKKKIFIGIGVALAIGTGLYFYFRKNKEDEVELPKEEAKDSVATKVDETVITSNPKVNIPSVAPPTKTTAPSPTISTSAVGKVFKSKGDNKFYVFVTKKINEDIIQPDGTSKRVSTNNYVMNGASYLFKDGYNVGTVVQVTKDGFFIKMKNGTVVFAPKNLLTV